MAVVNPPVFIEAGGENARQARRALGDILEMRSGCPKGGTGIATDADLAVTAKNNGTLTVLIAAGGAFIRGTSITGQGAYHVYNDATVELVHDAAEANPRIDLVIARVRDNAEDGLGTSAWALEIVKGTAAASPSAPATPANSFVLAHTRIGTATTNLTGMGTGDGQIAEKRHLWRETTPVGYFVCSLSKSAMTIPTGAADEKIAFNTEAYDPSGMHSGSSTDVTIPKTGTYFVNMTAESVASWDTYATMKIKQNGTKRVGQRAEGGSHEMSCGRRLTCIAGDVITFTIQHNNGVNRTFDVTAEVLYAAPYVTGNV